MLPHEQLGLAPDAALDDLHERFRGLAGMLHPRVGGDAAEFDRLRQAYEEFVAARCAALGVPAEPELALARQDPWAVTDRAYEGQSSLTRELSAGGADLARYAAAGCEDALRHEFAPWMAPPVEVNGTPMSFGGCVAAALLGFGIAVAGLKLTHPAIDDRLWALHAMLYLFAIVAGPSLLLLVHTTHDTRATRQLWMGSAFGLGLLFAALPPIPFLVQACERQAAAEAAAARE